MPLETKLSKLKSLMADGKHREALRLAASWPRLGEHKEAIQKGRAADVHPEFYQQIGQDPDALVAAGIAAIRERYDIPAEADHV